MTVHFRSLTFERLGHASVRIETQSDDIIYIDPWSQALDSVPQDGDIVFVTHDDRDHYDPDAIADVSKPTATIAVYEAVDTSDLAAEVLELPLEGEVNVGDINARTIPAYNNPDGKHVDESGQPFHAEGEVIGLLLTLAETVVCFPSDTDFLPHHKEVPVDVLIPPVGGHYTMDRHQAAEFARSVSPELVLPVHYDTFDAIETDVDAFADELENAGIRVSIF